MGNSLHFESIENNICAETESLYACGFVGYSKILSSIGIYDSQMAILLQFKQEGCIKIVLFFFVNIVNFEFLCVKIYEYIHQQQSSKQPPPGDAPPAWPQYLRE